MLTLRWLKSDWLTVAGIALFINPTENSRKFHTRHKADCYGYTLPEVFGVAIPICAVIGDQQASIFGAGCFKNKEMSCTMGTGTFLHVNTGCEPASSCNDRLGKEGSTAIGKHFNLGESTVREIKKNEAAIRKSIISDIRLSTKFASYTRDVLLERTERAIAIWIEEQVQRRIPVSGYLIQEKALQFYKSMKQSEPSTSTSQAGKEFSASKGWLTGFLKRNALHNIKITGESATADEGAAKIFPEELAKIIEDRDYILPIKNEIINLAHEIGGGGFNTFSHDDIDELLVDDALSDNDIIDLTLDLTVDGVVGLEGDNDEKEKSTPLTGKLIQEGLQLCSKLENHFLINDPNSE
ncbi:tigger transposable element-derived protein 1 [Trichonephila clavipes]|uniref:Tigger transposable element-derived protein 1 n=1 Tax=Trichonephila clavipes TaxID=2585209 RepID=A0A8X6S2P7_TRICX|nr:tigger transposable element-derived protein 1 [Trichonephila clavipes]